MKRKYEKPALIAEAFEMTESVAACKDASVNEALIVHEGDHFCGTSCSHMVGDNKSAFTQNWNNISLVDYAGGENDMYLFDASNVTCDFVWSKATDTTTDNTIFLPNRPIKSRMWYNVMGDKRWQNHTRYRKVSCWK